MELQRERQRDEWICLYVCEVLSKLLEWTHRSLVCHGKHKPLELSSGAFPPLLQGGKGSATTAFLCVLPLRPSEYPGDNGHVVNKEAAVEAAQTWAKGEHFGIDSLSHSCCVWNNEARTLLEPLQQPNIRPQWKMCCSVGEDHNGWRSDEKRLYLNFVCEDLVNIYGFLCLNFRGRSFFEKASTCPKNTNILCFCMFQHSRKSHHY